MINFGEYKYSGNNNNKAYGGNDDIELIEIEEPEEDTKNDETTPKKKLKVENHPKSLIKSERKGMIEQVFNHEGTKEDWKKDLEIQSLKERVKALEEKLEKRKGKYKTANDALQQKLEEKNEEIMTLTVECAKLAAQRDIYLQMATGKETLLLGN